MRILLLTVIAVLGLVVSCMSPTAKTDPPESGVPVVTIPRMPTSITGYQTSQARSLLQVQSVDWKSFGIVPQIGNNYNAWVDSSVLPLIKDYAKNKSALQPVSGPLYSLRKETRDGGGNLTSVFLTTKEFDAWSYVLVTGGGEIRQLLFQREHNVDHLLALFYRKAVDDMNDIVEILEDQNSVRTKCVRTWGLVGGNAALTSFASIADLQGPGGKTTGVLLEKSHSGPFQAGDTFVPGELSVVLRGASPARFNAANLLVAENAVSGYATYPDKDLVLKLAFEGVNNADVAVASIDPVTLVSNLAFVTRSDLAAPFGSAQWTALSYTPVSSGLQPISANWRALGMVANTNSNLDNLLAQIQGKVGDVKDVSILAGMVASTDPDLHYTKQRISAGDYLFRSNDDLSRWKFTVNNGPEKRQLLYLKDSATTPATEYYSAVFYAAGGSNLNDFVAVKVQAGTLIQATSIRAVQGGAVSGMDLFAQNLAAANGYGIHLSSPTQVMPNLFDRVGWVSTEAGSVPSGYPSLSALKSFYTAIPGKDQVEGLSFTTDLEGGLTLTAPY